MCGVRRAACGVRCAACGVWCAVCGVLCALLSASTDTGQARLRRRHRLPVRWQRTEDIPLRLTPSISPPGAASGDTQSSDVQARPSHRRIVVSPHPHIVVSSHCRIVASLYRCKWMCMYVYITCRTDELTISGRQIAKNSSRISRDLGLACWMQSGALLSSKLCST